MQALLLLLHACVCLSFSALSQRQRSDPSERSVCVPVRREGCPSSGLQEESPVLTVSCSAEMLGAASSFRTVKKEQLPAALSVR